MEKLLALSFYLVKKLGMPLVVLYHVVCSSVFLNTEIDSAVGADRLANQVLAPLHYLLAGQSAFYDEALGHYRFKQRFDYSEHFGAKTLGAFAALPVSLVVGTGLKACAYLNPEVRALHRQVAHARDTVYVHSQRDTHAALGIQIQDSARAERLKTLEYPRNNKALAQFSQYKEALKDITSVLNKYAISHWLDCGTLLGAYRHSGFIEWDDDVDLGILQPEFENVFNALKELDPKKYATFDWSSRDQPQTYIIVHIKGTGQLIDIYSFGIEKDHFKAIVSNWNCMFLPSYWRQREARVLRDVQFDTIFPLRKVNFDGIEAFVPNCTKKYLEDLYGDLRPCRIYNETTQQYEKDLEHPYWRKR